MHSDSGTIKFYDDQAATYANWSKPSKPNKYLETMLQNLPNSGHVLDFGCGAGWASKAFLEAGFQVTAMDASKGLIEQVGQHPKLNAICAPFESLDAVAKFDGIWASYSLQHAPRDQMPDILARISKALKPNGVLYIGVQRGPETELLSNLVFEDCWSCGDLAWVCGFNSVFERDASDDFGEIVKAA